MAAGPHVTTRGRSNEEGVRGGRRKLRGVIRFTIAAEIHPKGAQLEVNIKDRVPKKDQIFQGEQKRPISHALMVQHPVQASASPPSCSGTDGGIAASEPTK